VTATADVAAGGATTWWDVVRRRAGATPDRAALVDDRGRRLTWGGYRDAAERVAAALHGRGVRAADTVCWQLPTGLEAAVLLSALARLGVRQNPLMPVLRRAELAVALSQLRPRLLVVPEVWAGFDHAALGAELVAEHGGELLTCALPADALALPEGDPADLPPAPDDPDAVRWVFYTSGTTGTPKGAMHTDRSLLGASNGPVSNLAFQDDDVFGITYPIAHVGGPGMLAVAVRLGASCVLVERFDAATSPFHLAREGVTLLGSAAPFFAAYLAAQERHGAERLFPRLRVCNNGGAPLPPEMMRRLERELGGEGVVDAYGLTECPMVTYPRRDEIGRVPAGTAGRPGPGVRVRIVGADGHDLPAGAEGEVRLHGPQLFRGYVDSSCDADAFDDEGYVRTGDLGLLEHEGSLRITGRLKDVIVRNAENISGPEVEAVLSEHPAVAEAAAVGVPDARTGERVCAFLVLAPGADAPTVEELGRFFAEREVARYKVPEQLEVVDRLPRNAMGKLLKQQLREQLKVRSPA
jgi:acyl-CoA synthetase (AMP-forming)/AMP-acid ligase II